MGFQVVGLEAAQFSHLYGRPSEVLAPMGVQRMTVDSEPGFPCRVSLRDVAVGESVLLLNYEHLGGDTPFRSSHAIFVQDGARRAEVQRGDVPDLLRTRLLSVRAFDVELMMVDADIVEGSHLESLVEKMFSMPSVSFLHLHNASRGCFLARVDR